MVYKFLNEYLAKLSLLTAEAAVAVSEGHSGNEGEVAEKSQESKFTTRSSVSSIFDFNDKEKIERQIML